MKAWGLVNERNLRRQYAAFRHARHSPLSDKGDTQMPVTTKFIKGKYRVVDDTGKLTLGRHNVPVDGQGHDSPERAQRQADRINETVAKRKEEQ